MFRYFIRERIQIHDILLIPAHILVVGLDPGNYRDGAAFSISFFQPSLNLGRQDASKSANSPNFDILDSKPFVLSGRCEAKRLDKSCCLFVSVSQAGKHLNL